MGKLQEKLKLLPDNPGVYIMLDRDGVVIYVGKARVLKNRVRQYFHGSYKPEKVASMVEHIADFYYIITQTEIDALALENNLIKKYKPKYNILLKDDKTYPYIKVHTKEEYPQALLETTGEFMPPAYADNPRATGHGGMDFALLDHFFTALLEGKPAPISLREGLAMTLPGIYAEESAKRGGQVLRMTYPWDADFKTEIE